MANSNLASSADQGFMAFGQWGAEYLVAGESATVATGRVYKAVQCLETAVVTFTQGKNTQGDDPLTSIPMAIGTIIYGRFTEVDVTSGKVLAYIG